MAGSDTSSAECEDDRPAFPPAPVYRTFRWEGVDDEMQTDDADAGAALILIKSSMVNPVWPSQHIHRSGGAT